jgi:hypothetical protein
MKDNETPKVLVVSTNAWRDNTGINTLIELFRSWNPDKIAQIYTKSALPKTTVCNSFFQIIEISVMKSVVRRSIKTGAVVENSSAANAEEQKKIEAERKLYTHGRKRPSVFLCICREIVWLLGKWKSQELDRFIENFNPDVLFIPIYPTIYMGRIQKYIIKKTNKPVISYLSDDNYTYKSVSINPFALWHRSVLRKYVRFIVKNSKKLLVIAPKQKEEYDRVFGVNSMILTKGIDFSGFNWQPKEIGTPIRMVYTGKLIIGRWATLSAIADALGAINANGLKITLDIYTTDIPDKKQSLLLNRNGCEIKGALDLNEVKKVQQEADILVFAESITHSGSSIARLSFSSKITDYLKSGRCIFAVGAKDIAPIDYFIRNDAAVVCNSEREIAVMLDELIDNPAKIIDYGRKAFECGRKNHEKTMIDHKLKVLLGDAAFGKQA